PDRTTGVARCRLDPEVLDHALPQEPAVGDAVEGDTAGQAQPRLPGHRAGVARHAQQDLLGDLLDRAREVALPPRDRRLRLPRWTAEQRREAGVRHAQAVEVA